MPHGCHDLAAVFRYQVLMLFRYLKQSFINTRSALHLFGAGITSEPEAWLLASFVLLNAELIQRCLHPFAGVSLFMEGITSEAVKGFTHRHAKECRVLLQCLVALVRHLDLYNRHGCLGVLVAVVTIHTNGPLSLY